MDLDQLRCFAMLAEELHFARAAARVGMPQSGMSRQIAALETSLGGRLFNRTKRSAVTLTTTGALFLPEALAVLRQAGRAEALGRLAARGQAGRLEIGFVASAAWGGDVSALVRRYHEAVPGVDILLREMETPRQLEDIAAGRLDIGFVRARAAYPVEVQVRRLRTDALVLAVPEGAAPGAERSLPFIVPHFGEEAGFVARIQELGAALGFAPRIAPPVRDFLSVLTAVAAGLGVGLVPETVPPLPGVTLRRVEAVALTSDLMLASRRAESSPAVKQFLALGRGRVTG
jgi:DNA-binding transcriptional LysR family regulator